MTKGKNKLNEHTSNKVEYTAEDFEDVALYTYLSETRPEGKEIVTGKEKEDFSKFLGLYGKDYKK